MYQTKPTTYHQRKGKNTIVGFGSYYNVFRINSDVKRPYNMNIFVKKITESFIFLKQLNSKYRKRFFFLWLEYCHLSLTIFSFQIYFRKMKLLLVFVFLFCLFMFT